MSTPRAARVWSVYLLRCADGTFYTGIAVDVEARFKLHAKGRGARYTRGRGPLTLVFVEPAGSHGDALRREAAVRKLGRAGKESLALAAKERGASDPAEASAISDPAARPSRS